MDLAKIIGELKLELQCLDTAIASMEELARVQNLPDSLAHQTVVANRESGSEAPPPPKRPRGRPRKHPLPSAEPESQSRPLESVPSDDDSSVSAA